jgi:uncharacterized membrane protein YagU involved in acid resistance
MSPTVAASLGGLAATLPMTVAMEAMFRRLSLPHRYPLPPRAVSMRLADTLGMKHELGEQGRLAVTLLNHFGYGTAAGALYGLLGRRLLPGALGGAVYGLGVWAGSYLGLLPASGLYPSATEESANRNALMIAAHLVWGAALGVATEALAQEEAKP